MFIFCVTDFFLLQGSFTTMNTSVSFVSIVFFLIFYLTIRKKKKKNKFSKLTLFIHFHVAERNYLHLQHSQTFWLYKEIYYELLKNLTLLS